MDPKVLDCPVDLKENLKEEAAKEQDYDLINFYLQPEFLKMFSQQLAGQPKVDIEKVAKLREAINNKSLVVDPVELAEKIVNFESELFKSK